MDPTLRAARHRYSVPEAEPLSPAGDHYAAARRWLACAREDFRWASAGTGALAAASLVRACEALVRAGQHRDWARRWRARQKDLAPVADPSAAEDEETRALLERVRVRAEIAATVRAYYAAARQALRLTRVYSGERGTSGRREREALAQVARYRLAIHDLRDRLGTSVDEGRPGVRKTAVEGEPPASRQRVG